MNLFNNRGFISFGGQGGYSSEKKESAKPEWQQAPDYAEAEGARGRWWDLIRQFAGEDIPLIVPVLPEALNIEDPLPRAVLAMSTTIS